MTNLFALATAASLFFSWNWFITFVPYHVPFDITFFSVFWDGEVFTKYIISIGPGYVSFLMSVIAFSFSLALMVGIVIKIWFGDHQRSDANQKFHQFALVTSCLIIAMMIGPTLYLVSDRDVILTFISVVLISLFLTLIINFMLFLNLKRFYPHILYLLPIVLVMLLHLNYQPRLDPMPPPTNQQVWDVMTATASASIQLTAIAPITPLPSTYPSGGRGPNTSPSYGIMDIVFTALRDPALQGLLSSLAIVLTFVGWRREDFKERSRGD